MGWMRIFIDLIAVLVIVYSILGLALFFMQPKFVYKPVRTVSCTPEELGMDFENVYFRSPDGFKLNGWYIPADNAGFTVLFCHGNGGNIMHYLYSISIFHSLGLNCL
jgi:hypothetical protein